MKANLDETAKIFGVNRRTLGEWLKAGCPGTKTEDSWTLDTAAVFAWRLKRAEAKAADSSPVNRERAARTRKLEAEANLAELKGREQEGLWLLKADVERDWFRIARIVRDRMLMIPSRQSHLGAEDEPMTKKSLYERKLTELSNSSETEGEIDETPTKQGNNARDAEEETARSN